MTSPIEANQHRMTDQDNPVVVVREAIRVLSEKVGPTLSFATIMEFIIADETNPNRKWDFSVQEQRFAMSELLAQNEITLSLEGTSKFDVVNLKTLE